MHHVTLHSTKTAPRYFTFHQDTVLLYVPRLRLVTLYSTKTASCNFTFHQGCKLLLCIPPRVHLVTLHSTKTPCYHTFHRLHPVTLHSTKTAPCYFKSHKDCTMLFYIPQRMHQLTLHSTKTAPCYFTFHQYCTMLFYIPPRLHIVTLHTNKTTMLLYIPPRLYLATLHSTKTAPCYFTIHQEWTFSQVVTKVHFIIPKPVAPESACLIVRVHHIVTTGVGNYRNATLSGVMFTPISSISQMIQTLKCDRQTGLTDRPISPSWKTNRLKKITGRGGYGRQIGRDMWQWVNRCEV